MKHADERHHSLMVETLLMIPLFSALETKHLNAIALYCDPILYSDGDVVISENEKVNRDLYALISGHVEILSKENKNVSSEIVISKENKVILGEISWLSNGARTASVRCIGEVEAIRIDGQQLMGYLAHNPEAGYKVMHFIGVLLAKRLVSTDNLLKQLLWNLDT